MTKKQENIESPKKMETQEKSTKNSVSLETLLASAMGEDGEKKPKKRPYLHFKEFGLVIPFWAIVSVEKNEQLRTIHSKVQWAYEIIINRGVESSPNMPFGEHALSWNKEELRDAKFDALIKTLAEHNYEMNEI